MKAETEVMHAWLSSLEQVMHDVSLWITKNIWDESVNYALIDPNILWLLQHFESNMKTSYPHEYDASCK